MAEPGSGRLDSWKLGAECQAVGCSQMAVQSEKTWLAFLPSVRLFTSIRHCCMLRASRAYPRALTANLVLVTFLAVIGLSFPLTPSCLLVLMCYLAISASSMHRGPSSGSRLPTLDLPLTKAAIAGDLGKVQELLDKGANFNETDHGGWTPFIRACEHGHLKIAKLLKERGATVNTTSSFGWSALGQASENGHLKVVKWLLKKGADVKSATNSDKVTPLWQAVVHGHVQVAAELRSRGAEIEIVDYEKTPLLIGAVRRNQVASVTWLSLEGADFKVRCASYGNTAFLEACKHGFVEMVEYLHAMGPLDLAGENNYDSNPMSFAVNSHNLDLVKLLFSYGWKYIEGQQSPILGVNDVETLDYLLDKGLPLEYQTRYGTTPLSYAAYNGQLPIVKRLVERGADPRRRDSDGKNAYDMAVSGQPHNKTEATVEYLSQFNDPK